VILVILKILAGLLAVTLFTASWIAKYELKKDDE
jgi:hypothetical protein